MANGVPSIAGQVRIPQGRSALSPLVQGLGAGQQLAENRRQRNALSQFGGALFSTDPGTRRLAAGGLTQAGLGGLAISAEQLRLAEQEGAQQAAALAAKGRKADLDILKNRAEQLAGTGEELIQIMQNDPNLAPELYQRFLDTAKQANLDVSDAPPAGDPNSLPYLQYEVAGLRGAAGKLAAPPKSKLLTPEEEAQKVRIAQAGRPAITVNTGPQGIDYGDPPKDTVWARDLQGHIALERDPETGFMRPIAVPIKGGTVAAKRAAAEKAEALAQATQRKYADVVTEDIERLKQKIKGATFPITGIFAIGSVVPGTSAFDAAQLLDTIRGNIGFDRLQEMRAASPTGGALGQVSELELYLLNSSLGALTLSQTEEQLTHNLNRVLEAYLDSIHGFGNRPTLPPPKVGTSGATVAPTAPPIQFGASSTPATPAPSSDEGEFSGMTRDQLQAIDPKTITEKQRLEQLLRAYKRAGF